MLQFLLHGARRCGPAAAMLAAALAPAAHAAGGDACALLTPAQVGAALGSPVGAGSPITPTDHKVCTWRSNASGGGFVTLMLQSAQTFDRARQEGNFGGAISVIPVAGLGQGAMYVGMGDNVGLVVKKAGVSFKVAVYKHTAIEAKKAAEKTLAADVLAHL